MSFTRLIAGRRNFACGLAVAVLLALAPGLGWAADPFPFDQELILDAAPMRPAKRMPTLNVAPDGNASIGLWCKTVTARVELSDAGVRIEPGPLPEALPEMMGNGQCSAQRLLADQDMLDALAQVTAWRAQGGAVVLAGPKLLKFRPATN
jgi:heat shock protein HslJ